MTEENENYISDVGYGSSHGAIGKKSLTSGECKRREIRCHNEELHNRI